MYPKIILLFLLAWGFFFFSQQIILNIISKLKYYYKYCLKLPFINIILQHLLMYLFTCLLGGLDVSQALWQVEVPDRALAGAAYCQGGKLRRPQTTAFSKVCLVFCVKSFMWCVCMCVFVCGCHPTACRMHKTGKQLHSQCHKTTPWVAFS